MAVWLVVQPLQVALILYFLLLPLLAVVRGVILVLALAQQLADQAVVAQEVLPLQELLRERLAHQVKVMLVVAVLDMVVLITLVAEAAVLVQLVMDRLPAPMEALVVRVLQVALQALL